MTEHDKALEAAARALAERMVYSGISADTRSRMIENHMGVSRDNAAAAITAYHAALAGQGESEIAEIVELALNECIGRSKVTPSILTGRGRKEIAGIAASVVLTRLAELERVIAEIRSLRSALAKCREETVAECAKVADEFADNLGSRHTEYAKLAERIRALASTGER